MEYAKGGDLLDRILDKTRERSLSELETKFFVWQILIALLYLHTQQTPVSIQYTPLDVSIHILVTRELVNPTWLS